MNQNTSNAVLSLIALAALALPASAAITSTSGGVTQIAPPPACGPGALTSLFQAFAWDEQQGVTSTGTVCDEINNPGSSVAPLLGVIAGTFDSHFIHFEPTPGVVATTGTVTFASAIRGVIFRAGFLDVSDAPYGAFGTIYPTGFPQRGVSNFPASNFSVVGNTLNFTFFYPVGSGDVMQLRILTDAVPAPGALGAFGLAGVLAAHRRRR